MCIELTNRYVVHKYVYTYINSWKRFHFVSQVHKGMLIRIVKRMENTSKRNGLKILARRVRFRTTYRKLVYWAKGSCRTWSIVKCFCAWMVSFCCKNVLKMTLYQRVRGNESNNSVNQSNQSNCLNYSNSMDMSGLNNSKNSTLKHEDHVGVIIRDIQHKMSLHSIGMVRLRMLVRSRVLFDHATGAEDGDPGKLKYPTLTELITVMNATNTSSQHKNSHTHGHVHALDTSVTGLLPPSCRKYLLNALEAYCLLKSFNNSGYSDHVGGNDGNNGVNNSGHGTNQLNGSFISTNYLTDDNDGVGVDLSYEHSRGVAINMTHSVLGDRGESQQNSTFWDIDTSSEEELESVQQRIAHRNHVLHLICYMVWREIGVVLGSGMILMVEMILVSGMIMSLIAMYMMLVIMIVFWLQFTS